MKYPLFLLSLLLLAGCGKPYAERYSWDALPDVALHPAGPVTTAFIGQGVADMRAAGRLLLELPYGRTSGDRGDYLAVLQQGRGTCSSKHALLAALAIEQGVDLALIIGVYEMSGASNPKLRAVLDRAGLDYVPEAHCYVMWEDKRIDLTMLRDTPMQPLRFLHEERIVPAQIRDYKPELHQRFMRDWVRSNPKDARGLTFEQAWQVREDCIAALSQ
jgi:hypothetical protein